MVKFLRIGGGGASAPSSTPLAPPPQSTLAKFCYEHAHAQQVTEINKYYLDTPVIQITHFNEFMINLYTYL